MAARDATPVLRWGVDSPIFSIAISHNGTLVASGSEDCLVRVWDIHTGCLVLSPLEGHTGLVRSVAWSHNDLRIVSGSYDRTVCIWDARTGALIRELNKGHVNDVNSVAFSSDSTRIISGSDDMTIRIWDAHTGAPIGEPLTGHSGTVRSVLFSHDSTRIISGSGDHTIRIWNALTGALVGEPLKGHIGAVCSVDISYDSTRIVSGSEDDTVCIWDTRTGAPVGEPLRGHTDSVVSVKFSSDSTRIVSGSWDRSIRIWDPLTGVPIGEPLRGHTDVIFSVAFSPDSTRIVSDSSDQTICVWKTPHSSPSFDMVTSSMSSEEMFKCLVWHGCNDLSSSLDANQDSWLPITNGGFGDIWRVTLSSGSVLAVKTLRLQKLLKGDSKGAKRAAREVYHWSRLKHSNVQELLGIVVFRGALGMVSPWLEYGNLSNYLVGHPEVQRHPLCIQLTAGVSYLHSVGMVHGDLKANNVLVSDDGILKINDFDHAVLSDTTLRFSTTSRPGGGTMRWMAPELYEAEDEKREGEPQVMRNKQTDIYALGMTMLEIFTGEVPFAEYRTDAGVCKAIMEKKIPRRPIQLSSSDRTAKQVWKLLVKCWSRDPVDRPDTATVLRLLKSLDGVYESVEAGSSTPGTLTPTSASASTSTLNLLKNAYKKLVK